MRSTLEIEGELTEIEGMEFRPWEDVVSEVVAPYGGQKREWVGKFGNEDPIHLGVHVWDTDNRTVVLQPGETWRRLSVYSHSDGLPARGVFSADLRPYTNETGGPEIKAGLEQALKPYPHS